MLIRKVKTLLVNSYLLSFLIVLFVLRLIIPQYIKFILFPLIFIISIFSLIGLIKKLRIGHNLVTKNLISFLPFIGLAWLYLFSFISTSSRQILLFHDFINILTVFAIALVIWHFILNSGNLAQVLSHVSFIIVMSGVIIGILGLLKLFYFLCGVRFEFLSSKGFDYPIGTSLAFDSNFYSLVCIFSIIFLIPHLIKEQPKLRSFLFQISLLILFLNIFLSTSRRGIIILGIILIAIILVWFISIFIRNSLWKNIRNNTLILGLCSLLLISIGYYLLYVVKPFERNRWLSYSKFNQYDVHNFINLLTLSTKSIFVSDADYINIDKTLWVSSFDPNYPFSGWATGNYTPVAKLYGDNVSIVPSGANGAKVDRYSGSSTWSGNAYYYSKFFEGRIEEGKRYIASVYCYVSPEFDGEWVRISSNGKIKGLTSSYYDLKNLGKWQKMEISFYGDTCDFSTYLYIAKFHTATLDSLNGHVIFAYPELKEVNFDSSQPLTWAGSSFDEVYQLPGKNSSIVPKGSVGFKFTKNSLYVNNIEKRINANSDILRVRRLESQSRALVTIFAYVSEDFNGDNVYFRATGKCSGIFDCRYNLAQKGRWEKLTLSIAPEDKFADIQIGFGKNVLRDSTIEGFVIFAHPEISYMDFDPNMPLSWSGNLFSEVLINEKVNKSIFAEETLGCMFDKSTLFYKNSQGNNFMLSTFFSNNILFDKRYISSIFCYVSDDFNGDNVKFGVKGSIIGTTSQFYDNSQKGKWQKLFLNFYGDTGNYEPYLYFEIPYKMTAKELRGHIVFAKPEFKIKDNDPREPFSYACSDFERVYPLSGQNSDIIPSNVAGYKLNKNSQGRVWNNLFYNSTEYSSAFVQKGDSVVLSVYCFVSEDFNGDEVRLEAKGSLSTYSRVHYDLKMKGEWKILEKSFLIEKPGFYGGLLYFHKNNTTDFKTLKGYVIFAYPTLSIIPNDEKKKVAQILNYPMEDKKIRKASIISGFNDLFSQINLQKDTLAELPSFYKEMDNNIFAGPRLDRWRYAIYLYKNEYNFRQKIIGGGFGYTRKFAKEFLENGGDYDYPHNPFLSVLLYSGIIGLFAYFWFLYKAVYYYWLYRKEYWPFALCYAVAFFFAFFSSLTPFDPAIVGIFGILPYLIHYYHIKDEEAVSLNDL